MSGEDAEYPQLRRMRRTVGGTTPEQIDAAAAASAGPVLARFARPTAKTPTRIAVVADPHVSTHKEGTWKVFHRTRDRLEAAVADVNERGVDGVVFTGDLTEDGRREDFDLVASVLADLDAPYFAVPGNHDVPKAFDDHETPPLDEFEESHVPDGLPFVARVGGVDVIGLNSAAAPDGSLDDGHDGALSEAQLDWLDGTLANARSPVVVMHHNLAGLLAYTGETWRSSFPARNAADIADVLARHDAPLHVSGHLHVPAVAETRGVRELVAPALSSFPQAYLLLEVDESGTTVRYVPVADADGAAEAYTHATDHTARSRAVAELTLAQLSALPLVDELADAEVAPLVAAPD